MLIVKGFIKGGAPKNFILMFDVLKKQTGFKNC